LLSNYTNAGSLEVAVWRGRNALEYTDYVAPNEREHHQYDQMRKNNQKHERTVKDSFEMGNLEKDTYAQVWPGLGGVALSWPMASEYQQISMVKGTTFNTMWVPVDSEEFALRDTVFALPEPEKTDVLELYQYGNINTKSLIGFLIRGSAPNTTVGNWVVDYIYEYTPTFAIRPLVNLDYPPDGAKTQEALIMLYKEFPELRLLSVESRVRVFERLSDEAYSSVRSLRNAVGVNLQHV
jgi:hypothetical protein